MGFNHTSASINYFTVNGAAGPNIGPYQGGGGQSCCGLLPRQWYPGLKVVVEWEKDPDPYEASRWTEERHSPEWMQRMETELLRHAASSVVSGAEGTG